MAGKQYQNQMTDNTCKIHVTNLKKNFGGLEVLKDISLDVTEGKWSFCWVPPEAANPPCSGV